MKFNSDDKLSLSKSIEIRWMITVIIVVFHENRKYHHLVFLDECL